MVQGDAISVVEAQQRIIKDVRLCATEVVPLAECCGRVLAEPLSAKLTQPPFDASGMDGYAVRACDVETLPARITVKGESAAGRGFVGRVGNGEGVRIFTGAPIPDGADAIVIQENVRAGDGVAEVIEGVPEIAHIRKRGGDFSEGDVLVPAGETVTARHVTLAAAMGYGALPVRRRPVVAVLSTGNELVSAGTMPGPDQIVASNGFGIAAMLRSFGADTRLLGIARDTRESLRDKISAASEADILVTIGGASVGDHDLVGPVLREAGMDLDFWKVAMRPGKPALFGRLGGQRVIGVPGNPVSSLICARVFVVPLVRAMLGLDPDLELSSRQVVLCAPLRANGPRQHYMRASLTCDVDGVRSVAALPDQDSSLMVPMVRANAMIVRPARAPEAGIGENVTVVALDF